MFQDFIPSTLTVQPALRAQGYESISTERALNQMRELIVQLDNTLQGRCSSETQGMIDSSLDDIDFMLKSINR